jgi:WD40 repeat protein
MRLRNYHINTVLLFVASGSIVGCAESPEAAVGQVSINLVGQGPSGTVYRLRDAVITVTGPTSRVWSSEDDPDQTSLSDNVLTGSYSAALQDGWRLERLEGASTAPVSAALLSDNPVLFTVTDRQRANVGLRFQAGREAVDMSQGYDIVVTVQPPPPPVIAVVNSTATPSITVYPSDVNGNPSPRRVIAGPATTLIHPHGITVDHNQLIVCESEGALDFFSADATGNVPPTRRIAGPATTLSDPFNAVVFNGEIYVGQSRSIAVFPATASGNVVPTRTITGIPIGVTLLAIDRGELYATSDNDTIRVYPLNASGAALPTRTIDARSGDSARCPAEGLAIAGGSIYVSDSCSRGILVFPDTRTGLVAPTRTISGTNTGLAVPGVVSVFQGELFVTDAGSNSVRVFPASGNGNLTPTRTISGNFTGLGGPVGAVVF